MVAGAAVAVAESLVQRAIRYLRLKPASGAVVDASVKRTTYSESLVFAEGDLPAAGAS